MKRDELFTISESPVHGRGLFAAQRIPPRTLLGRYEGEPTRRNGAHVLWVENGDDTWHGIRGRNDLRFVNHSDDPNAVFEGDELWSLRNIRRGEEITHHYGDEFEA